MAKGYVEYVVILCRREEKTIIGASTGRAKIML